MAGRVRASRHIQCVAEGKSAIAPAHRGGGMSSLERTPEFYRRYTAQQVRKAAHALASDRFRVALIHRAERGTPGYQRPILRTWPMQELYHPATIVFLRGRNRDGYHVFFRPDDPRCVMVDDVSADAIAQMQV